MTDALAFEKAVEQNAINMNAGYRHTRKLHGHAARQTCEDVKQARMVLMRGKKGATSSARLEETVKQWAARKAEVHKRQAHRNMADAKRQAAKAEAKHKARLRRVQRETKPKRQ